MCLFLMAPVLTDSCMILHGYVGLTLSYQDLLCPLCFGAPARGPPAIGHDPIYYPEDDVVGQSNLIVVEKK